MAMAGSLKSKDMMKFWFPPNEDELPVAYVLIVSDVLIAL
jgi:hypothetical protein